MNSGVYEIVNLVNGKRYIGSSKNIFKRFCEHKKALLKNKHHSIALQRAWNKYGESNFQFNVILFCSVENNLRKEQEIIDALCPEYNIAKNTKAPMLGRNHSQETISKMKLVHTGMTYSLETKKKISRNNLGKKLSNETKIKISEAHKGLKPSKETRERMSVSKIGNIINLGRKLTEEHKLKISNSGKGRKVSEETKNKISAGSKGRSVLRKNKLGFRGVYFRYGKFYAEIKINGKKKHLGVFENIKDAAIAYDKSAKENFGIHAILNY